VNTTVVTFFLQSGYFSSMFGGQWKESSENVINLEIPDPNIDKEGVYITAKRSQLGHKI